MSAISGYISTIQNAVYGEQVRGAIANAIEQCYDEATESDYIDALQDLGVEVDA